MEGLMNIAEELAEFGLKPIYTAQGNEVLVLGELFLTVHETDTVRKNVLTLEEQTQHLADMLNEWLLQSFGQ